MQRRAAGWLLRVYPHGLRTSGNNMSPLPFWLAGTQNVALNFSDNDLAVQLHFALFHGSKGFVIKPAEMKSEFVRNRFSNVGSFKSNSTRSSSEEVEEKNDDDYWPPPRDRLHRTSLELLSLVNLPKVAAPPPHTLDTPVKALFMPLPMQLHPTNFGWSLVSLFSAW